jgi:hypothetical protein
MSKFKIFRFYYSFYVRELPPTIPFVSKVKKINKVDGPDTDKTELIMLEFFIYNSYLLNKIDDINQPPGVKGVVSLLQLNWVCDIFTPRNQSQETNVLFLGILCGWSFWVINHIWYDHWQPNKFLLKN